ncbi:epoxide hydrolase [Histoplasma capsulatum var. duboisii H88]|uniref:Epoxide hydrolase n=2 Tax=Ajellomyces capsulatus TaxID=5037 RepID=A0A8A1LJC0_AJEC8|nr:epoxide hydrolase [Histoplasma capsulatum H143]QSS52554.1 epoxide hydrolase [Histoplasma capsulatum var. duboisii H88]
MTASYSTIPSVASKAPEVFHVAIPEQQLSDFKTLLKLSKIPAPTYESLQEDGRYGISHKWLAETKKYWEEEFDWRKNEEFINSFPNFRATVNLPAGNENEEFKIHFVALFSQRADAIPIALLHGWPGSFLEFLPLLTLMREKYTPQTLPYHLIVPSLPGYAFSSTPPLTRGFDETDIAKVIHQLMVDLGFESSGYLAQGGDLGSPVAMKLNELYKACKGFHINFYMTLSSPPEGIPDTALTESEKAGLERSTLWMQTGNAYALEHATRPSTIGLLLGASPLSLLGWIGEKFLSWSDVAPSTEEILQSVTLYWFTESMGRGIYPYRSPTLLSTPQAPNNKPFGYSYFPKELCPTPIAWARKLGNMVFHKEHDKGGHFAALEQPQLFMEDLEAFAAVAWKCASDAK